MRILVAEDRAGMRTLVAEMLKALGHGDAAIVEDGASAWEHLEAGDFDLLLTDRRMPNMDGVELVKKLRQSPKLEQLPVIMMSAFNEPQEVREAIEAGVDIYLVKPFSPTQLRDKISELDGRRVEWDVDLILQGTASTDGASGKEPLVLFAEEARTREQLLQQRYTAVRQFLGQAVSAIRQINSADSQIDIGYIIESESGVITRHLRNLRERIMMLVVSPSLGGGITLVRLASINGQDVTVILVCDDVEALPSEVQLGLQDLGVFVVERDELPAASFERLLREFVVARVYTPDREELAEGDDPLQKIEIDIRNMVSLPVLPDLFRRIQTLDNDPESDIRQWGEAVAMDPSSSAMIIRRAHSPIYGFNEEVNDVSRAVTLLGKKTVKELVACRAVKQAFTRVREKGFDVDDFWSHSLAVATAGRILNLPLSKAKRSREQEREFKTLNLDGEVIKTLQSLKLYDRFDLANDEPFVAGMMHDIGKVAMAVSYPGIFEQVVQEMRSSSWKLPMLEAEVRVSGEVVHTEVGRILAKAWGLGDLLERSVGHHHQFSDGDPMSALIGIADFVATAAHPFPKEAANPLVQLSSGDVDESQLSAATAFLPGGLVDALGTEVAQLVNLSRVLVPVLRQSVQELRQSMRD